MIPQRVKLAGFLSYKDEQEIRFDGSPLWMLSGTNGSGKSSVFDAVTFALFGHHRGGNQSAAELINKETNTLAVEFDFTSEKQLYRTPDADQSDLYALGIRERFESMPERSKIRFLGWVCSQRVRASRLAL